MKEIKTQIKDPSLKRLFLTAGVKRIESSAYGELRKVAITTLESVIHHISIMARYGKRKTVTIDDVYAALEVYGIRIVAGINYNSKSATFKTYTSKITTTKSEGTKKRIKPGVATLKQISYRQKHSDRLVIPKANFERIVRHFISEDTSRFQDHAVELLQYAIEAHLIRVCEKANRCTQHAGRQTLEAFDIILALDLMN